MTRKIEDLFGGIFPAPHQIPFTYTSQSGGETSITLPFYPIGGFVTINSGVQVPVDNFDITDNILNLGSALQTGDVVYCLFDKILSPADTSSRVRIYKFLSVGGETSFTPDFTSYGVQSLFIDGKYKIPDTDYSYNPLTNIVTLASPLPASVWVVAEMNVKENSAAQSQHLLNIDNNNRQQWARLCAELGLNLVSGSFEFGGSLNSSNDVLWQMSTGKLYQWIGSFPKNVPFNSTPISTGGAWVQIDQTTLRSKMALDTGSSLIGFKLNANAISRFVSDKLKEFVSVDDYGAKGDGTTIDDAAFQAAFTYSRRVILTPGKEYVLKNGFGINVNNTVLSGYGAKIKYIKPDASYYHAIRVGTTGQAAVGNVVLEGFSIYCSDNSLVRGDTGFAINVANAYNVDIHDISISAIASAGIWAGTSDIININNVTVTNNLADGIHITDGASNFRITNCFVRGCHDDAIAVVSDVPSDGSFPIGGVVANNIVSDNNDGHAFVAIGCASVLWEGNLAKGCKGPGFGSYFWQTTGTPADEDWVRNCVFRNNVVTSCGLAPVNASNATSFFVGALKDCVIENNRIDGAPGMPAAGTEANCLLIANALNVIIQSNEFNNSNTYGICCRDGNTSATASFSGIHILKNTFDLIAKDVVHIYPNASIGEISVLDNILISSPFDNSLGRSMIVGKTGVNKLTIAGNKNTYNNLPFSYDAATVSNVIAYSNTPALELQWTPVVTGDVASPTATAQGYYTREGDTINFTINLDITALNGSTAPIVSLPMPARASNRIWATGRENSSSGAAILAIPTSTSTFRIVKYDNTSLLSGKTPPLNIIIHGSYLAA